MYKVIAMFPLRGKQADFQPDDEGSEPDDLPVVDEDDWEAPAASVGAQLPADNVPASSVEE